MIFKHIFALFLITIAAISCNNNTGNNRTDASLSESPSPAPVTVQWADTSLDLGNIPMGDTVVFYFRFTNTGTSPLILQHILTGCSCTTAYHSGTALAPGMTDSIKAVFDTRKSVTGFISKTLLVKGNMLPGSKVLRYQAVITGHKSVTGLQH